MKNSIKILIPCLAAALVAPAAAQEIQLTQTYGQAAISNAALLCADGNNKVTMGYHTYYGNLTSPWREYSGMLELATNSRRSAFGLGFLRTEANNRMVSINGINLMYALNLRLTEKAYLRFGLQGGLRTKSFNNSGAVYEDMIDPYNGVSYQTGENMPINQKNYFNLGSGLSFNTSNFFLALGVQNANKPNTAFNTTAGIEQKEDMRIRVMTGYAIPLGTDPRFGANVLIPHASYTKYGPLSDMGGGITYQNSTYCAGLSYYSYAYKASSLITTIGFMVNDFKVGYNVGINMGQTAKAGGISHELGVSLLLFRPKDVVKGSVVPMPMF